MNREELLTILAADVDIDFAQDFLAYIPADQPVTRETFSAAYRAYREAHPNQGDVVDAQVRVLADAIERYTGIGLKFKEDVHPTSQPSSQETSGRSTQAKPQKSTTRNKQKGTRGAKETRKKSKATSVATPQPQVSQTPGEEDAVGTQHLSFQFPTRSGVVTLNLPYPLPKRDVEALKRLIDALYS